MSINPTLAQCRAVVAVARHRSFSQAARRLHVAQSSLSRTVAEVERACGVQLFARTTRHVAPTAEGVAFVEMAERILRVYDEELAHFGGYLEGQRGVLRVAALPSLAATLLPQVVDRFREALPGVDVQLEDSLAAQLAAAVRAGRVDLALTAETGGPPGAKGDDPLRFEVVAGDDLVCLVARGHPFARRAEVAWAELASEPFISFDEASSIRAITDATFAACDVEPRRRLTARNVATVAGMCAAGLGVTAVPGFVVPLMAFADLVPVPLVDPVVRRQVGVLTDPRRQPSPAVRTMLEVLRSLPDEPVVLPPGAGWAGAATR